MKFEQIKGKLGFGCMRLPMNGTEVDLVEFEKMVDEFISAGFNYFDTARGYLGGKSEKALKECLTSRYPRDAYILTNKLSSPFFKTNEEIRPFFESQLESCGVEYFDFYLMHSQDKKLFEKYKKCRAYETALELLKEGKIKHFGISFHDTADVLEEILKEYPEIEVVQLQFNYADYEDASVQSRLCYEVCCKYSKPVIVMEPVKGGSLVSLPKEAQAVFDLLNSPMSTASYAIRFAAGFSGVVMVLSGMGDLDMLRDNMSYMSDFSPLNEKERAAVDSVCEILRSRNIINCTACRYCTDGCPKNISIPDLFACLNARKEWNSWNSIHYYDIHTQNGGKASECIGCAKCEDICPQHLPIRKLLVSVAEEFEKKEK